MELLTPSSYFNNIAQVYVLFKAATCRRVTPIKFFLLTTKRTELQLFTISTMRLPCILFVALCKKVLPCSSIGLLKSILLLHSKFSTKLRSFLAKASRKSKRRAYKPAVTKICTNRKLDKENRMFLLNFNG